MNQKKKQIQHIRDIRNPLTEDYFKNLFNLQMEFQLTENPDLIEDIITELTKAVEYYGFINDPRGIEYENRLTLFITNPKILKLLKNDKPKKQISIEEKRMNKQMKMRVDFLTQITNTKNEEHKKKVDELIEIKKNENPKLLFDNEILKQEERFKEKLKMMRKKKSNKGNSSSSSSSNVFTPNLLFNSPLGIDTSKKIFNPNPLVFQIKKDDKKIEEEKKEKEEVKEKMNVNKEEEKEKNKEEEKKENVEIKEEIKEKEEKKEEEKKERK